MYGWRWSFSSRVWSWGYNKLPTGEEVFAVGYLRFRRGGM